MLSSQEILLKNHIIALTQVPFLCRPGVNHIKVIPIALLQFISKFNPDREYCYFIQNWSNTRWKKNLSVVKPKIISCDWLAIFYSTYYEWCSPFLLWYIGSQYYKKGSLKKLKIYFSLRLISQPWFKNHILMLFWFNVLSILTKLNKTFYYKKYRIDS